MPEGQELADTKQGGSQASKLVDLVLQAGIGLWHDPEGKAYATIEVSDHHENILLKSPAFRKWLAHLYYNVTRGAFNSQSFQDALALLEAKATFEGDTFTVYTRLAQHLDVIYLDLGGPTWQAVKIDAHGWQVIARPPVRFRRPKGMLALPIPEEGGSLGELKRFVNISEGDWPLYLGWLVAAMNPAGPFAVLVFGGEEGTAKTTTCRNTRALIDPNTVSLRAPPADLRDLAIAANNSWVLAFDNISKLPDGLSDAICRLSTGGGFATRELYTDGEEVLFDTTSPVLLNGIDDFVTRSDLLSRCILVAPPVLSESARRLDSELKANFEAARPRILGALLTAVACALGRLSQIHIERLPRMADFVTWATAAEPALGLPEGEIMKAYGLSRAAADQTALEFSAIGPALLRIAHKGFRGTASELLSRVEVESPAGQRELPKSPSALSSSVRRLAPNLRRLGFEVTLGEREAGSGRRLISIEEAGEESVTPVTSVTSAGQRDVCDDGDASQDDEGEEYQDLAFACSVCGGQLYSYGPDAKAYCEEHSYLAKSIELHKPSVDKTPAAPMRGWHGEYSFL